MTYPVPTPASFVPGVPASSSFLNANIRDAINFMLHRPHAVLVQATVQSFANASGNPVTFDTSIVDDYNGHSTVTNPSRYVAQRAGWYSLAGVVAFSPNTATTYKFAQLYKNGASIPAGVGDQTQTTNSSIGGIVSPGTEVFLNVGDYVELWAWQNTGAALNSAVPGAAGQQSGFLVRWEHA